MDNGNTLRVLVVGATGLVGQGVLQACLQSADVARVAALVRRPGSVAGDVDEIVLPDFQRAATLGDALAGFDACFYCAGAPPVGTPEAEYREVTLQVTRAVADAWAAANPEGCFLYVSGAHANPGSRIMPLRVKGETERALAQLPVRTVMLRPAGVRPVSGTGTRHALLKPFYLLARPLMAVAEGLLPALTTSNRAIGQAMIALAGMPAPPAVVECALINRLARGPSGR
ncbi:NAD(P)H-binding protein [Stenotrophomonas sp. ZAC14A_NAIMI4_1]|uniref:NAD(P)H-binding protein n=1 Tax=Stenotrophomonas sp. ZAC14A_NAIMI4_1 TaxID=2072412 RepID=UPI000D542770|nr:NAD(P)H-binding protein [Stenotrophomonas sp. ZAC14A_NAIMI4_1]AWH46399.1 oxidoreductase [Stenotrophomonas sp. ZAC14A_NAIMI4_1]